MIKLLYFSGSEWGNMGWRKPRLAHEFSCQKDMASVLYVEPPVTTSVLDVARGRFEPGHLATNRRAHADAVLGRPRQIEDEALGNVHFLGARTFDRLVPCLRGFDVCTLPHELSTLTRSMNPIKLYDYLATGKPIVSTPVVGVERFTDIVRIAKGPTAFVSSLEAALSENGALTGQRLAYARANTWTARADQTWRVIQSTATDYSE